jgi:hypothetical protein
LQKAVFSRFIREHTARSRGVNIRRGHVRAGYDSALSVAYNALNGTGLCDYWKQRK